ncbi:MAG TPA: V-type ATPase 116kDa subunit family protein [Thiobacillaceae bacterium]|nr:V-type ATPase 116kDa subunit family protein [Thiobacillaceae bacterium]
MHLRPTQAQWFETYVPSEQTVGATEALAKTGVVQLELDPGQAEPADGDRLHYFVSRFRDLAAAHADDLPSPGRHATSITGSPVRIANQALYQLTVWGARIDFLKEHIAQLRAERDELLLLAECLEGMQRAGIDYAGLFKQSRHLCKCLFTCPKDLEVPADLEDAVEQRIQGTKHDCLYIAGVPERHLIIERLIVNYGCEQVAMPAWLSDDHVEREQRLQEHLSQTTQEIARLDAELASLRLDPKVAEARANVETLGWYLEHATANITERRLSHITGWTTAEDTQRLQQVLHDAKIKAIVRFPNPPQRSVAPVALLDTWWSRPFQPLLAMWGTPGREEVDPTGLLAVVVPLLFGYMFPDVGHGLVLAGFAALYSRRQPRARFLIPCGLAAAGFGLLFGEVFGFHGLLPALWMHPMDDPVQVLVVPLLFGVGLMLVGLVFAGFEAGWHGGLRHWLLVDGAVLLLYASALAGIFLPEAFWLSGLAIVQYLGGSMLLARRGEKLDSLSTALGELLLSAFELTMNTLSFLRVGAFALGHAALSYAVLTLAGAVENPIAWGVVVVLGNIFAMALEGLLVFVQTTRLVLFEFFVRFLQAEGRLFRPVAQQTPGSDI